MIADTELAALLATMQAPTVQDAALAALAGLQPEPVCRVCMLLLDARDADLGTHSGCEPAPRPGAEPAPTLAALGAALLAFDRGSARSQQVAIGPSEIGVACDRRLGYALRNAPRQPDERVPWAPLLGTALHALIADALRAANEAAGRQRWLIEQRVQPSAEIAGNTDAYDTETGTVVDWKLVGKSTVEKAQRSGPGQQYEWQAHTYGRGWQRLGYDPQWVRIVFLPRWSHTITDAFEWTAPYSRRTAEKALDRVQRVDAAIGPYPDFSAIEATTVSGDCFFCPHRRASAAPADFNGCPGVRSKAEAAVTDYLATLPTE